MSPFIALGIILVLTGIPCFIVDYLAGVFGMSFIGILLWIFGFLFIIMEIQSRREMNRLRKETTVE